MEIRELDKLDLISYKKLRLKCLKEFPTYFSSSYLEESKLTNDIWLKRLKKQPGKINLGLFYDNKLASMLTLIQDNKEKLRHHASIFGVFTKKEYQNKGFASLLMESLLNKIDNEKEITCITLQVESENYQAQKLYKKFGFIETGIIKDIIKYNDKYFSMKTFQRITH